MAPISPSDAWAVSFEGRIERWDGSTWRLARFTAPGPLLHVSAVAKDDVWAVGYAGNATLTVHWDGFAWSVVPSPSVGVASNRLNAVDALSADDVWAVGSYFNGAVYQTLTEHWNGSAWSVVASPDVGPGDNQLSGVTAIAGDDVWAVGSSRIDYTDSTLALHWNGTAWAVVPTPGPGDSNVLSDVAGVGAHDVWAVGSYGGRTAGALLIHWNGTAWEDHSTGSLPEPSTVVTIDRTDAWAASAYSGRVLHWDGAAWAEVSTPAQGQGAYLFGVGATSRRNVWTVGYIWSPNSRFGFAERFDGSTWSVEPPMVTGYAHDGELRAVAAVSTDDLWAVGDSRVQPDPLIEHWDGAAWSIVPGPSVGASPSGLRGVSAVSASSVWAAGWAGGGSLVEHFDGSSWNVVAVPNIGTLYGVTALSDDDVWAAGSLFFLHFDGTSWTSVPSPLGNLSALAGIAPDDLYAVSRTGGVEHFDGTAWSVSVPRGGPLFAVTGSGPDDVWAFGRGLKNRHWDGVAWSRVPGVPSHQLLGGSAVSPDEAWAVGSARRSALVNRWDGTSWTRDHVEPSPTRLDSIVALPSGDIWAVGVNHFANRKTFVVHGIDCGNQAPTVTPPTYTFVSLSQISDNRPSAFPIDVTWSGSDPDGSIAAYDLEMSVDGGPFTPVNLSDPTVTTATVDVTVSHAYVFRVRATDSHGLTGDYATGSSFTPQGYQDATLHVGIWRTRSDPDDWRQSDSYTGRAGAFSRFNFTGQAVAWIGAAGPGYGFADVYVDGVLVSTIDQHSDTSEHRAVLFGYSWDTPGPHAIRIVNRASNGHPRTSIDGFVVLR